MRPVRRLCGVETSASWHGFLREHRRNGGRSTSFRVLFFSPIVCFTGHTRNALRPSSRAKSRALGPAWWRGYRDTSAPAVIRPSSAERICSSIRPPLDHRGAVGMLCARRDCRLRARRSGLPVRFHRFRRRENTVGNIKTVSASARRHPPQRGVTAENRLRQTPRPATNATLRSSAVRRAQKWVGAVVIYQTVLQGPLIW